MSDPMRVELVSPEKILFSGDATMVVTRTLDGEIAFQPHHAPLLAALAECHTRIYLVDGSVEDVAAHGGFVQVANNKVSLLCDVAELAHEIDRDRAQRAKATLEGMHDRDEHQEAALRRAHARLSAAGGASKAQAH